MFGDNLEWTHKIVHIQGIMTADVYVEKCLVPSIDALYNSRPHRFMQDNDTSKKAQEFFLSNNINWWRTPPESPDANPIENLWHEKKVYMRVSMLVHEVYIHCSF